MKVNLVAYKYKELSDNWNVVYHNIIGALKGLGLNINVSPHLKMEETPSGVTVGIEDNSDDVYIYNHTYPEDIQDKFFIGKTSIFVKPTGPTNKHFSVDTLGYGSRVSITYNKPNYENISYKRYWGNEVKQIKNDKSHKWDGEFEINTPPPLFPPNHVLIIGQMPGDTSVRQFSFGNHFEDIKRIVYLLDGKDPVVIKLHPFLEDRCNDEQWMPIKRQIAEWVIKGHTVLYGFENIHDILPSTKVAILENSTAGIECLLHDVPMITFGCPEYRWVCKELRQIIDLNKFKNDLSWFNKELSRKFLVWYIRDYLCSNVESTKKRLKEILF